MLFRVICLIKAKQKEEGRKEIEIDLCCVWNLISSREIKVWTLCCRSLKQQHIVPVVTSKMVQHNVSFCRLFHEKLRVKDHVQILLDA